MAHEIRAAAYGLPGQTGLDRLADRARIMGAHGFCTDTRALLYLPPSDLRVNYEVTGDAVPWRRIHDARAYVDEVVCVGTRPPQGYQIPHRITIDDPTLTPDDLMQLIPSHQWRTHGFAGFRVGRRGDAPTRLVAWIRYADPNVHIVAVARTPTHGAALIGAGADCVEYDLTTEVSYE